MGTIEDFSRLGIEEAVRKLATTGTRLGVQIPSMLRILEVEDWASLILATAFIEVAIDHLLSTKITPEHAAAFIRKAPLSRKLSLGQRMGLYTQGQCEAASHVVDLRNDIAHSSEVFSFSFAMHVLAHPKEVARFERDVVALFAGAQMKKIDLTATPKVGVAAVALGFFFLCAANEQE